MNNIDFLNETYRKTTVQGRLTPLHGPSRQNEMSLGCRVILFADQKIADKDLRAAELIRRDDGHAWAIVKLPSSKVLHALWADCRSNAPSSHCTWIGSAQAYFRYGDGEIVAGRLIGVATADDRKFHGEDLAGTDAFHP